MDTWKEDLLLTWIEMKKAERVSASHHRKTEEKKKLISMTI